jgi:Domain of unknown function (DUF4157)
MKTTAHLQTDQPSHRTATEFNRPLQKTKGSAIIDNRSEAVAQRKQAEAIHNSSYMVARRQQLRGMFGAVAQLMGGSEEEDLLQGKFESMQRKGPEEEDLLQGKFVSVQRQGSEDEELIQGKFPTVQRNGPEEDELLQGKFDSIQRKGQEIAFQMKPGSPSVPSAQHTNNTGLPDHLKSGIESLSGLSMDDVTVHYNSSQPAQLNALAYTQGTDIHVAPGQEQHLPHEAWHVVQQAQGRVQPTMQLKDGVPVNDDQGLEREADVMGAKAAHSRESILLSTNHLVQQRKGNEDRSLFQGTSKSIECSGPMHTSRVSINGTAAQRMKEYDLKADEKIKYAALKKKIGEFNLAYKGYEITSYERETELNKATIYSQFATAIYALMKSREGKATNPKTEEESDNDTALNEEYATREAKQPQSLKNTEENQNVSEGKLEESEEETKRKAQEQAILKSLYGSPSSSPLTTSQPATALPEKVITQDLYLSIEWLRSNHPTPSTTTFWQNNMTKETISFEVEVKVPLKEQISVYQFVIHYHPQVAADKNKVDVHSLHYKTTHDAQSKGGIAPKNWLIDQQVFAKSKQVWSETKW